VEDGFSRTSTSSSSPARGRILFTGADAASSSPAHGWPSPFPASDAFEERGDAIPLPISPPKHFCLTVRLPCWRQFSTGQREAKMHLASVVGRNLINKERIQSLSLINQGITGKN
jgi:hypothetical protein